MRIAIPLLLLALLPARTGRAQPEGSGHLPERVSARLVDREAHLVALRHDIHRNPELSGQEERTAGLIADELDRLGYDVRRGVGGHGVIGVLRGSEGPTVAFRADMDAVRSDAPDPADYRSVVPGVRHICGHDVHTTIGLGVAESFATIRDEMPGTVMLIFQPAEEQATGAKAMLADGVFGEVVPDAIYAVHTAPYEVGHIATAPGAMMARRSRFTVTLRGTGDLMEAADEVRSAITAVGTLSADAQNQPQRDGFVVIPTIRAARSQADGSVRVAGQLTTSDPVMRDRAEAEILGALADINIPDVSIEPAYEKDWIEGVTNDPALVTRAEAVLRSVLGDESVHAVQSVVPTFSEDFGSFQSRIPGVMFFLGVSNSAAGTIGMPHTPDYVADDGAILVGARALVAVMLERMGGE